MERLTFEQTMPQFTVFTAAYNRAKTLHRVYEALLAQTLSDFEWLIVDDGSEDDTEMRVRKMINEGRLLIRYFKKKNGGVHTAHNMAIREAKGVYFLRLDSDDSCVPQALEILLEAWKKIPADARDEYSGVSCLCKDEYGRIIGDSYPLNEWDSSYCELAKVKGEKWGFHRTALLKDEPFPEFSGERFCPEGLVWARLHNRYKTRCINIPLRIYFDSTDSINSRMVQTRYSAPKGVSLYYSEQLDRLGGTRAFRNAINYVRFSLPTLSPSKIVRRVKRKGLVLLVLPIGLACHTFDRLRGNCL